MKLHNYKSAVRWSACLLLAPSILFAQVPAIADLADCIPPLEAIPLAHKRAELVQRRDQIKAGVSAHNGRCGSVPAGSPAEQTCRSEQADLNSQVASYAGAVREFNKQAESAAAACRQKVASHEKIGAAAGVKGTVYWLTSDGRKVPITDGSPIYMGARIVTESGSRMQVLLLDETVFTVGPNSDMVLDEFVYDPVTTAGKIAASVIKGTFRFVTGNVMRKDPEQMKVNLPVIAVGIRGTDFEVEYRPGTEGYIKLYKGELQITEKKTGAVFPMSAGQMLAIHADDTLGRPVPLPPQSH